jgi:hypothetical protein
LKADTKFQNQPKSFWAYVRTISQKVGYTEKAQGPQKGTIKIPSLKEMMDAMIGLDLDPQKVGSDSGEPSKLGQFLSDYFVHRANLINREIRANLMNAAEAAEAFREAREGTVYKCPFPMNKQKEEKRAPAFLTGMVNMIVEKNIGNHPCNYDPRTLTTVTANKAPIRTLARRVDGASRVQLTQ